MSALDYATVIILDDPAQAQLIIEDPIFAEIFISDGLPGPPGPAGPRFSTYTVATTATLTPNPSTYDAFAVSAQAGPLTIANPSPMTGILDGRRMILRIRDNGTTRALTFGAAYRPIGNVLPISTSPGKLMYMGFMYNSADALWDLVAITPEA